LAKCISVFGCFDIYQGDSESIAPEVAGTEFVFVSGCFDDLYAGSEIEVRSIVFAERREPLAGDRVAILHSSVTHVSWVDTERSGDSPLHIGRVEPDLLHPEVKMLSGSLWGIRRDFLNDEVLRVRTDASESGGEVGAPEPWDTGVDALLSYG
jgi:hypothetical protein